MRIDQPTFGPGGLNTVATASVASRVSQQTIGLQWSNSTGTAYLSPVATGGNINGNATWLNNTQGVRLISGGSENGTVWWNLTGSATTPAFDFNRDFQASFMTFFDGIVNDAGDGDGHYFNFGGNGASNNGYAVADNSLSITYDPYPTAMDVNAWINAVKVADQPLQQSADIQQRWVTWTIRVQRNFTTGKRELSVTADGLTYVVADITAWTPAGNIVTVGAWSGAAFCPHYVYTVKLEYI